MSESLNEIERVFLALSDKTRIRLVGLMGDREVSVNYLCESLGESQPKVSRHLAYLRTMGMVNTRRDGKWIYYSLSEPESRFGTQLLSDTITWIASITEGRDSHKERDLGPVPDTTEGEETSQNNIYVKTDMSSKSNELEIHLL